MDAIDITLNDFERIKAHFKGPQAIDLDIAAQLVIAASNNRIANKLEDLLEWMERMQQDAQQPR